MNVVNLLASQWGELMTNVGDFDGKTTWGSREAGGDGGVTWTLEYIDPERLQRIEALAPEEQRALAVAHALRTRTIVVLALLLLYLTVNQQFMAHIAVFDLDFALFEQTHGIKHLWDR